MSGTINSLGLGSGVLTADLLDKLKAADTAGIITPIENKITLNTQKAQAYDLLNSLMTSFKSSVSSLGENTLYQARTVSGNNDGVSVSAVAGTQIRDFSLNVTNIAKKSVVQSGSYSSLTAPIANGPGTLNIGIGGQNFSINYTASTTLSDLRQAINDAAGSKVTASTLQTGTSQFNLILASKTTGLNQSISLTDISGNLSDGKLITPNTKSGSFLAADDFIAATGSSGNMTLDVGGVAASFAYTDTTRLQDIADAINADTTMNTKVTASLIEYGTNDLRMVFTPKSGHTGSAISMMDSVGGGLSSNLTTTTTSAGTMGIIQDGADAHFTFDGISMTRSTNSINDIATGMTINLLKDSGSANIAITQDRSKIADNMTGMVNSYNTLVKQLDEMTGYDATAGKVGIFNGDNTIKNIRREITRMLTSVNSSGYALPDYGISLDKSGSMSFNSAMFTTKMDANPDGTEKFFSTTSTVNSVGITSTSDGLFTALNTLLNSYTSTSTGTLFRLTQANKDAGTNLTSDRTKANALLTARYETLSAKFAAYDSMIAKLNSQFSALKQQINAQANTNN